MRPFGHGAADFLINGRAAPNMKKVIRLFVFLSSPSLFHPSCGLFVCQASSAHPPPKTPAPPPHPARETKKRTKRQKKSRQKLNLIPYQKKPSLEKSKIFNLENDKEVLAFLGRVDAAGLQNLNPVAPRSHHGKGKMIKQGSERKPNKNFRAIGDPKLASLCIQAPTGQSVS